MLTEALERSIAATIMYLESEEAFRRLAEDAYWPKWNAPWWHMLLLNEMGQAHLIPQKTLSAYVESLNRLPLKIFPIHPDQLPAGVDPSRGYPCLCQLGNVYRTLYACGVDVDTELPWIKPWFHKYQMADGGFNCDEGAYLVKDETPSSMVGSIAVLESLLGIPKAKWSVDDEHTAAKLASFLMKRQLIHGSETAYNADERKSASEWIDLCFPRFYLYDILRGLSALLHWAEVTGTVLPTESTSAAIENLCRRFPDDEIKIGRRIFENTFSRVQAADKSWGRGSADHFPLLKTVSAIGSPSPFLKHQWLKTKERIEKQPNLAPYLR